MSTNTPNNSLVKPELDDVIQLTIMDLAENFESLDNLIGNLNTLKTKYKDSVAVGINSLYDDVKTIDKTLDDSNLGVYGQVFGSLNERLYHELKPLVQKTNFISVKEYEHMKVAIAEGYDWSDAINFAIEKAKINNKKVVLHADEDMYITKPIKPGVGTKLLGFGKFNSIIRIVGGITAIDLTGTEAKTGLEISSLCIYGDSTPGQIGIDAYYLTNGSSIKDIRIEWVDTAIKLSKSWYAAISDIYIRGCLNYGLHLSSTSATEQVNGIEFKSIFVQRAKHAAYLEGANVSAGINFQSCTFELSKKTAVVSKGYSPLNFTNCYFENNYQDALTTKVLTWNEPIDVKVEATGVRNLVKFDSCYLSRRNNFVPSAEKTSIYLGTNMKATLENCQFVCNTSSYIDANIYSISDFPPNIRHCSEDGFAKTFSNAKQKEEIMANGIYNLKFSSTLDLKGIISKTGDYYLRFIPFETKTITETITVTVRDAVTKNQLAQPVTLPKSYTAGTSFELFVGSLQSTKAFETIGNIGTTTDTNGAFYLVRKYSTD